MVDGGLLRKVPFVHVYVVVEFPVLNFNSLATRVAECTGQKIKPSDLSIGSGLMF